MFFCLGGFFNGRLSRMVYGSEGFQLLCGDMERDWEMGLITFHYLY